MPSTRSAAREFAGYVAVSAGGAVAASSYAMLGQILSMSRGTALLAAVAVAGLLCLCISGSVAELASLFPSAPGIRTYLRAAFGDTASLCVTIEVLFMVVLFVGIETHVVMMMLRPFVPDAPEEIGLVVMIAGIIVVNISGLEPPRLMQNVTTYLLLVVCVGVALYALLWVPPAAALPAFPSTGALPGMASAAGAAVFLFMGFEWVTPLGRSPKAYERQVPWAMVVALLLLILMYELFAAAVQAHVAPDRLGLSVPAHLALGEALFGRAGQYLMAGLSLLAMMMTFNAGLMGASRLVYAVAREGHLPAVLARISISSGAPVGAILLVGGLGLVTALVELELGLHVPASLICAAIACFEYSAFLFAAIRLRATRAAARRPFRTPVPLVVQWCLALLMPVLGVASLLADPRWTVAAVAGFVLVGIASVYLARTAQARFSRNVAFRQAAMAAEAS